MQTIEEIAEEYIEISGGDYSIKGFVDWFTHRLWKKCPMENCKWCAKEGKTKIFFI